MASTSIKALPLIISFCESFYYPSINSTCFRREVTTNLMDVSLIQGIFTSISVIFYLLQCHLSRTIQFEFKNIDIVRCLYNTIHSTLVLLFLYENSIRS